MTVSSSIALLWLTGFALFSGSYLFSLFCGAVLRQSALDTGEVERQIRRIEGRVNRERGALARRAARGGEHAHAAGHLEVVDRESFGQRFERERAARVQLLVAHLDPQAVGRDHDRGREPKPAALRYAVIRP